MSEVKEMKKEITGGKWKLGKPFSDKGNTILTVVAESTPCEACNYDRGEYLIAWTFKNAVPKGQFKFNAELIADAGNTYHSCLC